MNLYEINSKILECIDEETGEILNEDLLKELKLLKEDKMESICLYIKNLKAENVALKTEIDNLAERKERNENKIKRLTRYVDRILQGQSFKTPKTTVFYRKSKSIDVDNIFVDWAKENNPDLLSFKEPTPNKTKIKQLLESGEKLEFARIVENNNINIK